MEEKRMQELYVYSTYKARLKDICGVNKEDFEEFIATYLPSTLYIEDYMGNIIELRRDGLNEALQKVKEEVSEIVQDMETTKRQVNYWIKTIEKLDEKADADNDFIKFTYID